MYGKLRKGKKDEEGKTQGTNFHCIHAGGVVQWGCHFEKQFSSSSQNYTENDRITHLKLI